MDSTFVKTLIAMVPAGMLLFGSSLGFLKTRSISSLQLIGAGSVLVVVLTHLCEALNWFPGVHWVLSTVLDTTSTSVALFSAPHHSRWGIC
jgi:hypothetical protein